jgi:uncharacterized membrane protein YkvA (DUF1232 family)
MARIKRSVWSALFKSAATSAKRLIKNREQLGEIIREAISKMHKHSAAIEEISADLQIILRMLKAWLVGDYKEVSLKSLAILIAAILYFLNPFDAIPDAIPVVGYVDDISVVAWVIKTLKNEIERFRDWEAKRR